MNCINTRFLTYLLVVNLLLIFGCKKSETNNNQQENTQIKQRFQGKCAITSALSNQLVDVNLDGVKSTDMLKEIADLKYSYLELRITDNIKENIFSQFWQNQIFPYGSNPVAFDPKLFVMYANQGTVGTFNFNANFTQIELHRSDTTSATAKAFSTSKIC